MKPLNAHCHLGLGRLYHPRRRAPCHRYGDVSRDGYDVLGRESPGKNALARLTSVDCRIGWRFSFSAVIEQPIVLGCGTSRRGVAGNSSAFGFLLPELDGTTGVTPSRRGNGHARNSSQRPATSMTKMVPRLA
jgi:hypothetical protein